jgi:hypothetical protein
VLCGLVAVEVLEHGREALAAVDDLGGLGALTVHVDDEVGVFGEERLLVVRETAIGAVGVGVNELADRQAIRGLGP